ncbi:MAG TPA: FecR domain-containing protein [Pseudobacter sp.]|nr:FecR domain-containing protein [Pseudobacter sp.]
MHNDYLYYLLNKQAGGAISPEEALILEKWYNSLQQSLPVSAEENSAHKQQAWEALQHQLGEASGSGEPALVRTLWKRWTVAAAILAVFTGLVALVLLLNRQEKQNPITWSVVETGRQKKNVTLPDGSRVWVNAHSKLRFANGFDKNRHIILDYGEAFFDVTRDTQHPFLVKVDELDVSVLGTAFNIQSFPQLSEIKVAVTQGKVAVDDSLGCHEKLLPDQCLTYTRNTNRFRVNTIDPSKANDWKNGKIWLNNISLKELAVYIRNIYDYEVVFSSKDLEQCKNTINFSDKDQLKDVLELLKIMNKVRYRIQNKTIYLDGIGCP